MKGGFDQLPLWLWIIIAVTLLSQSTWMFLDARKHSRFPWFWGMIGIVQTPWPLIIYLIAVRRIHRTWGKKR